MSNHAKKIKINKNLWAHLNIWLTWICLIWQGDPHMIFFWTTLGTIWASSVFPSRDIERPGTHKRPCWESVYKAGIQQRMNQSRHHSWAFCHSSAPTDLHTLLVTCAWWTVKSLCIWPNLSIGQSGPDLHQCITSRALTRLLKWQYAIFLYPQIIGSIVCFFSLLMMLSLVTEASACQQMHTKCYPIWSIKKKNQIYCMYRCLWVEQLAFMTSNYKPQL